MSISKSNGRIWAYSIAGSIILVFGFCVATIVVTGKANIQESDDYMTHYQDADANANKLIYARISFDKKYKVKYISDGISETGSLVKYEITDLNSKPIENAKLIVAITRPETKEYDDKKSDAKFENGLYSFSGFKFVKPGVWNLTLKVSIGDDYRFYNVKADTRNKNSYEY